MAYTNAEARQQLLDELAEATEQLALALASLGEAYELLDDINADRVEQELFRPVQAAYGRAQRTHAEFAERHGLPTRSFAAAARGAPSTGSRGFIDAAIDAVGRADATLSTLQVSMLPVEVGDPPLRSGLQDVRMLLGDLRARARALERTLGR